MINWKDYKDSLSSLSNKEKGDSFERLIKQVNFWGINKIR